MAGLLSKATIGGVMVATWVLRRVDYYVTKSVVSLEDNNIDPHTLADRLRPIGSILRSYTNRGWIIGGHAEVTELLRDERISNEVGNSKFIRRVFQSASGKSHIPFLEHPSIQQVDPPDHTRLRKLVAKGFVHKYIQSLTPTIESLVDELVAAIDTSKPFDVIDALARPLPAIVIAEMMGVPVEDRFRFEAWSEGLLGLATLEAESIGQGVLADMEMREYMTELVAAKRSRPGQDFISELISAEEDGDKLTIDELLATCVLLLVAGHETTTRLLGSTILLLLQHPEQLKKALSNDVYLEKAIEESLRMEPPVLFAPRVIKATFDYKGFRFKKGQIMLLSLSSANRDPSIVSNPDRFDVERADGGHISFGHGIHLCLGMTLARIESKVALTKLLARYPGLELANSSPDWGDSPMFRGLKSLPLTAREADAYASNA